MAQQGKTIKARFAQKNDTYENWGYADFKPMKGEFLLINDRDCPIAIGDGQTPANELRDKPLFKLITTEQIDSLFNETADVLYEGDVVITEEG